MKTESMNLAGKLLVAMPGMGDVRFEYSVIYICAHSKDGTMGLIVNKPNPKLNFKKLLSQLNIRSNLSIIDTMVHFGGPVEQVRGFILHSSDYQAGVDTLNVDGTFSMTATPDILKDIAKGEGPDISLLALGYSGWASGQLELELLQNGWLICDATYDLVFKVADNDKWASALASLGVDPLMLSTQAGRA